MPVSKELRKKLNQCDLDVKFYCLELERMNAKLQRRIVKLEVSDISLTNRINQLNLILEQFNDSQNTIVLGVRQ